jgi:hypothetical protein
MSPITLYWVKISNVPGFPEIPPKDYQAPHFAGPALRQEDRLPGTGGMVADLFEFGQGGQHHSLASRVHSVASLLLNPPAPPGKEMPFLGK